MSRVIIFTVFFLAVITPGPAYCANSQTSILLQQTPQNGGMISPEVGIHRFNVNESVVMTAIPNQGYHFVYWLGDVSSPASSSTSAYINSPKIIIAVFERDEYPFMTAENADQTAVAGGEGAGLIRSAADYRSDSVSIPGQVKQPDPPGTPTNPEVPEPVTGLLVTIGSLFVLRSRRQVTG